MNFDDLALQTACVGTRPETSPEELRPLELGISMISATETLLMLRGYPTLRHCMLGRFIIS